MALKHGSEYFTKLTHIENGKIVPRRIHRLEVQDRHGRLHILTGEKLPDYIQINTGHGYAGKHLGQILLGTKGLSLTDSVLSLPRVEMPAWPCFRDLLSALMGFLLFFALRFIGAVIAGCL